tara:strand:- start:233 stop:436 length:204 start_codon:yes stop_codon:yes gene_type:complete
MKTLIVEKAVLKRKHYGRIKSYTTYEVLKFNKTYYAIQFSLPKIKKKYKAKGYKVVIHDKGVSKLNY